MKTKYLLEFVIGVAIVAGVISTVFAIKAKYDETHQAIPVNLVAEPSSLSLGRIAQGNIVKLVFQIRNQGSSPVNIDQVMTSCGCTTAQKPGIIQPGKSGELHVEFNSDGKIGDQYKQVDLFSSAYKEPLLTLSFTGTVYKEIAVDPANPEIGTVDADSVISKTISVQRTDGKRLTILSTIPVEGVTQRITQVSENLNKVGLKIRPETDAGDHVVTLTLHLDDPNQKEITVPISYTTRNVFKVEPNLVNFGFVQPGRKYTKTIMINGNMAGSTTISSLPPHTTATVTRLSGSLATIKITFAADGKSHTADAQTILLRTNNLKGPIIAIPIAYAED